MDMFIGLLYWLGLYTLYFVAPCIIGSICYVIDGSYNNGAFLAPFLLACTLQGLLLIFVIGLFIL